MAIKLRVISDHYRELGENRSRVFGVNGGTVGRAPGNDWVLPDPRRVVSGHHFEVQFHSGKYWLIDTSTNGVFINDADDPASDTGRVELNDGDRLRVGDYDILVSLDNRIDFLPATGEEQSAAKHLDSDIGHSLNFDNLLTPRETGSSDSLPIGNAFGMRLNAEARANLLESLQRSAKSPGESSFDPTRTGRIDSVVPAMAPADDGRAGPCAAAARQAGGNAPGNQDWALKTRQIPREELEDALARRKTRVEARERSVPFHQQASTWTDLQSAVQAFCRGAGIDPATLSPEAQAMLPLVAGQLLREAVVGLNDILRARATGAVGCSRCGRAGGAGQQQQPTAFVDEHRAGVAAPVRIARATLRGPGRLDAGRAAGHA